MELKTHKVTTKFSVSEYEEIKREAKNNNTTMADLLREGWYEKQNSLAVFEEFDRRIKRLEQCITSKDETMKKLLESNDKKLLAIYKVLKTLSFEVNQEVRNV